VWHAHEVVQGVYFKLKSEKPALAGAVLDLAWSPDSTKIVAVGHGRDKYGEVFDMETGSSRGIITGHSKAINVRGQLRSFLEEFLSPRPTNLRFDRTVRRLPAEVALPRHHWR
jgi:WD40 repeat protein